MLLLIILGVVRYGYASIAKWGEEGGGGGRHDLT